VISQTPATVDTAWAPPDNLTLAIDKLILDTAATEAAGALLVAQAYLMRLGAANAVGAFEG